MFRRSALEMRVLVLAPIGRDAALLAATLAALEIETAISNNGATLLRLLEEGAGSAIITEEALTPDLIHGLATWLNV